MNHRLNCTAYDLLLLSTVLSVVVDLCYEFLFFLIQHVRCWLSEGLGRFNLPAADRVLEAPLMTTHHALITIVYLVCLQHRLIEKLVSRVGIKTIFLLRLLPCPNLTNNFYTQFFAFLLRCLALLLLVSPKYTTLLVDVKFAFENPHRYLLF